MSVARRNPGYEALFMGWGVEACHLFTFHKCFLFCFVSTGTRVKHLKHAVYTFLVTSCCARFGAFNNICLKIYEFILMLSMYFVACTTINGSFGFFLCYIAVYLLNFSPYFSLLITVPHLITVLIILFNILI